VTPAIDPLADLRGYHLPEAVSWWPPAPGWWLLALLALVLAAWGAVRLARRYRRGAPERAARRELMELRAAFAREQDAAALARGLSRLLRRYTLARFPQCRVAGLSGEEWLAFLDAQGGGEQFRRGPGRLLAEAPYRPDPQLPADDLAALVEAWISRNAGSRS
jgi:hypothetical protein